LGLFVFYKIFLPPPPPPPPIATSIAIASLALVSH
jgi:hypothetical protein